MACMDIKSEEFDGPHRKTYDKSDIEATWLCNVHAPHALVIPFPSSMIPRFSQAFRSVSTRRPFSPTRVGYMAPLMLHHGDHGDRDKDSPRYEKLAPARDSESSGVYRLALFLAALLVYTVLSFRSARLLDCSHSPLRGLHQDAVGKGSGDGDGRDAGTGGDSNVIRVGPETKAPVTLPVSEAYTPRILADCAKNGNRAKTFIMVFMGHSGSSAIISELTQHSQVHTETPELVDHNEEQKNGTRALFVARQFFERGIRKGRTPGFKMRPRHIQNDPKAWAELAREFDTRIIWQYRASSLKQAIGEYGGPLLSSFVFHARTRGAALAVLRTFNANHSLCTCAFCCPPSDGIGTSFDFSRIAL